jgi:hypothetical protein
VKAAGASRRRLNNEAGIKIGTVQEWRHPR